jgi:hypothetical protein
MMVTAVQCRPCLSCAMMVNAVQCRSLPCDMAATSVCSAVF